MRLLFLTWDSSKEFASYHYEGRSFESARNSYYYWKNQKLPYAHCTWIEIRLEGMTYKNLQIDEQVEHYREDPMTSFLEKLSSMRLLFRTWDASKEFASLRYEGRGFELAQSTYYAWKRAKLLYSHTTWIEVCIAGTSYRLLKTDEQVEQYTQDFQKRYRLC